MIFRPIKRFAAGLFGRFPEGRLKHAIRVAPLGFFSSLPRRAFINTGDLVLQVGAASPLTVHYVLDIVGPFGSVIVIEPERDNIHRLTSDARIAAASNITIVEKAAWRCRELLSFTVSKSSYDHKIEIPGIVHDNDYVEGNYCGTQSVQADTVDNILEELDVRHVNYAEIHVNGAELEVLRGMTNSLDFVDRIHLKGHSLDTTSNEPINKSLVDFLKNRNFVTKIAASSVARSEANEAASWDRRAGDVYGARIITKTKTPVKSSVNS